MAVREATLDDWPQLKDFFLRVYRLDHPLQNFDFWRWQYAYPEFGRSVIVCDDHKIYGHLGAYFSDGVSWIMNVYLDEQLRGKGYLAELYNVARSYYPIAATNINALGLGMYQKMGYIRYFDLMRFTIIRPDLTVENVIDRMSLNGFEKVDRKEWYWKQPTLLSGRTTNDDTFTFQQNLGGLRAVQISDPVTFAKTAWQYGARWIDYVTSWNDPIIGKLHAAGWNCGDDIPFRLDPLIVGSKSNIAFVSEKPLPNAIVVRRFHSDHGRVPSITAESVKN